MTNEKDLGLLSRTTKLVGGKIPAGTPCPFRSVCRDAPNNCNHKGEQHSVPYSCGTARAFDTFLGLPLDSRTLQQTPTEAPTSTPPSALLHATRLEREGDPQAAAELRRLYQHEMSHKVWLEKTGWVQETSHPWELGMHYADCLKQRIENLQASNVELREVLAHFMPFIESEKDNPRHALWVEKALAATNTKNNRRKIMTPLKALALSSGAHEHGARLSFTMQDLEEYTFQVQTQLAAAVRADLERFPKEDLTWRGAMEAAAKVIEEGISSPYKLYEPGVWHDYTPGVTPLPVRTQPIHYKLRSGTRMTNDGVHAGNLRWGERGLDTIESFLIVGEMK